MTCGGAVSLNVRRNGDEQVCREAWAQGSHHRGSLPERATMYTIIVGPHESEFPVHGLRRFWRY